MFVIFLWLPCIILRSRTQFNLNLPNFLQFLNNFSYFLIINSKQSSFCFIHHDLRFTASYNDKIIQNLVVKLEFFSTFLIQKHFKYLSADIFYDIFDSPCFLQVCTRPQLKIFTRRAFYPNKFLGNQKRKINVPSCKHSMIMMWRQIIFSSSPYLVDIQEAASSSPQHKVFLWERRLKYVQMVPQKTSK